MEKYIKQIREAKDKNELTKILLLHGNNESIDILDLNYQKVIENKIVLLREAEKQEKNNEFNNLI